MDHKEFFEIYGGYLIQSTYPGARFSVETLYQAIKARLIEELRVQHNAEMLRLSKGLYHGQLTDLAEGSNK